jgi:FMN-dependent NADH-azoreductase
MLEKEIKELLEKNQATLGELDKKINKVQSKLRWNTISGIIKTVVIITPLIWGVIYFSPLVKNYLDIFSPMVEIFEMTKNGPTAFENLLNSQMKVEVTPENKTIICNPVAREALIQEICK